MAQRDIDELLLDLAELHRTASKPYEAAISGWQLMQCPACDGNVWKIVRPGDPSPECEFLKRAKQLGVLK